MMRTAVSAKRCPECGKAAMLEALACPACGHRYRTRFAVPAMERTQAFDYRAGAAGRGASAARFVRLRTFLVAFAEHFRAGRSGRRPALARLECGQRWLLHQPRGSVPAPGSAVPTGGQAKHLYDAIRSAMSLYDLDQAAGGTGRVIRAATLICCCCLTIIRIKVFMFL